MGSRVKAHMYSFLLTPEEKSRRYLFKMNLPETKEQCPSPNRIFSRYEKILVALFFIHTLFFSLTGIISPDRMLVAGIDPVCYFSPLRSLIFDRDLDFENEYKSLDETGALLGYPLTPLGRRPNGFSVGPGLAVAPFYLLAHILVKVTGYLRADGFSPPYQVSCFFGIALYSLAALILLFKWARLFFKPDLSFVATALAWFASSAVYYSYPMTFMPHAISLFYVLLFLYFSEKTRGKNSPKRWILLGIFAGAMTIVRWQNILFILFLFPEICLLVKKSLRNSFKYLLLFSVFMFIVFLPQMLVWKRLYGHFFTIPQGGGFLLWTKPKILKILFSGFNGLFTWAPITLIGTFGLVLWMRNREKRKTAIILFILFLLQLYLNSIVYDWHGSWGFGMRRFLNCLPIFVFGIAALLDFITSRKVKTLYPAMALGLFVLWNYLFLVQYYLHLVARNRPLTIHELVWDKLHIYASIERRRLVNTARVSAEKGYMDDVDKALCLAAEIDPNHADIYFVGGQITESMEDGKMALELYQKALKLGPGDRDVINAIENLKIKIEIGNELR